MRLSVLAHRNGARTERGHHRPLVHARPVVDLTCRRCQPSVACGRSRVMSPLHGSRLRIIADASG